MKAEVWSVAEGAWRNKIRKARNENISEFIEIFWNSDGITQTELGKKLQMSTPTMLQYLKSFRDKELLDETQFAESGGGRRPRLIRFAYNSHFSIGIRVQRDRYSIVVINMKGELRARRIYEIPFQNTEYYWKLMNENCDSLCRQEMIEPEKIIGIGIAIPGVLRMDVEEIIYSAEIPGIDGMKFEQIADYFSFPVLFENEAAAAGYAEAWELHRNNDMAYLMVEEGIQGALISAEGIERGNRGLLGVFGHMVIHRAGKECVCGRKGCLEAYCSTKVLKDLAKGNLEKFRERLERGDGGICDAFSEYLRNLAIGVVNLGMVLDADIVVGGELVESLGEHMQKLHEFVEKEYPAEKPDNLFFAERGFYGSAIGAALQQNISFFNKGF